MIEEGVPLAEAEEMDGTILYRYIVDGDTFCDVQLAENGDSGQPPPPPPPEKKRGKAKSATKG